MEVVHYTAAQSADNNRLQGWVLHSAVQVMQQTNQPLCCAEMQRVQCTPKQISLVACCKDQHKLDSFNCWHCQTMHSVYVSVPHGFISQQQKRAQGKS